MEQNKIMPSLWYNTEAGNLSIVCDYYKEIFREHFSADWIIPLGDNPGGRSEMAQANFFGQKYMLMSTEVAHYIFTEKITSAYFTQLTLFVG